MSDLLVLLNEQLTGYSVILNGVEVILAPICDVAGALPYDPAPGSDIGRVAMPSGGRAKFGEVTLHHVAKFAGSAGTDPDRITLVKAVAAQCASIDSTAARQVAKPTAG